MVSIQEKAQCIWWLAESNSIAVVQRKFKEFYERDSPGRHAIMRWKKKFLLTGNLEKKKDRPGRPRRPENDVERICTFFVNSPGISMRQASKELGIPSSTINTILHRNKVPLPKKTADGKIDCTHKNATNDIQRNKTVKSKKNDCVPLNSNNVPVIPITTAPSSVIGHVVDVIIPDKECNCNMQQRMDYQNPHHKFQQHKVKSECEPFCQTCNGYMHPQSRNDFQLNKDLSMLQPPILQRSTDIHMLKKPCNYMHNNVNEFIISNNMAEIEAPSTNMHHEYHHEKELGIPFSTINNILHQN